MTPGVGAEKIQSMHRPQADAGLKRVVPRLRIRECRPDERIRRKDPEAARGLTGLVRSRIDLDEDRQVLSSRSHIAHFHAKVVADLLLHTNIEVVRVRCLEVRAPSNHAEIGREEVRWPRYR